MKSWASESIRNAYFNLERLSRSSRLIRPGIFGCGTTFVIQTPNFSCTEPNAQIINCILQAVRQSEHLFPFEFSSDGIKVFRYNFSETIPIFFNRLQSPILSISDRYKIFASD